ncbi:MAG: sulfatase-like hydrolase/transferase, partial [Verrucomicrobiae bacterium]|nr:sulfatase-like hydrolase/transferase [Verrucomicrobiae bacterium]
LNCMNRLDEGIGMVLEVLDEMELRENTFIIYISDHGADFPRGKTSCYEGGVKVPMIVSFPGVFPEGKVESSLVSTLDILPSFLKAAGMAMPSELPGRPLQDLLNPKTTWRKYIHTFNTGSSAHLLNLAFGIRDERYRLIYHAIPGTNPAPISRYNNSRVPESLWLSGYVNPPEFELFDLDNDPYEFTNLAENPKYAEIRARLFQAMQDFRKEINDPFLDPANVTFYIEEMRNPARHPQKGTDESWGHLEKFYHPENATR